MTSNVVSYIIFNPDIVELKPNESLTVNLKLRDGWTVEPNADLGSLKDLVTASIQDNVLTVTSVTDKVVQGKLQLSAINTKGRKVFQNIEVRLLELFHDTTRYTACPFNDINNYFENAHSVVYGDGTAVDLDAAKSYEFRIYAPNYLTRWDGQSEKKIRIFSKMTPGFIAQSVNRLKY